MLSERHQGTDLTRLGDDWIYVHIYEVCDPDGLRDGVITPGALRMSWWGEVARMPALLPESPEEFFERNFTLMERFVARHGHSEVPDGHMENGEPLWVWSSNIRRAQLQGDLRQDWAARLEALAGWTWLPGDEFFLVERFARREGHTDVPPEHREEGRPLGHWVALQRENHREGRLEDGTRLRLEAVPHWHW